MSKEIGAREKALREMREARYARKSLPPTHPAIRGADKATRKANAALRLAEREAAKNRGRPRKAKK